MPAGGRLALKPHGPIAAHGVRTICKRHLDHVLNEREDRNADTADACPAVAVDAARRAVRPFRAAGVSRRSLLERSVSRRQAHRRALLRMGLRRAVPARPAHRERRRGAVRRRDDLLLGRARPPRQLPLFQRAGRPQPRHGDSGGRRAVFPEEKYSDGKAEQTYRSQWRRDGDDAYVRSEVKVADGWKEAWRVRMQRQK